MRDFTSYKTLVRSTFKKNKQIVFSAIGDSISYLILLLDKLKKEEEIVVLRINTFLVGQPYERYTKGKMEVIIEAPPIGNLEIGFLRSSEDVDILKKTLKSFNLFMLALQECENEIDQKEFPNFSVFQRGSLCIFIKPIRSLKITHFDDHDLYKRIPNSQLLLVTFENGFELQVINVSIKEFKISRTQEIFTFSSKSKTPTLVLANLSEKLYSGDECRKMKIRAHDNHFYLLYRKKVILKFNPRNVISEPCPKKTEKPCEHILFVDNSEKNSNSRNIIPNFCNWKLHGFKPKTNGNKEKGEGKNSLLISTFGLEFKEKKLKIENIKNEK